MKLKQDKTLQINQKINKSTTNHMALTQPYENTNIIRDVTFNDYTYYNLLHKSSHH